MQETKQDKANFNEQRIEIQNIFGTINDSLDTNKNKIMTMEHFIDKYVPIRIQ